jgi:hypothetical protein
MAEERERYWDATYCRWRYRRGAGPRHKADGSLDLRTIPRRQREARSASLRSKWPIYHPTPQDDIQRLLREHYERPGWSWKRTAEGFIEGVHESGPAVLIMVASPVQLSPRTRQALRKALEAAETRYGVENTIGGLAGEALVQLMLDH